MHCFFHLSDLQIFTLHILLCFLSLTQAMMNQIENTIEKHIQRQNRTKQEIAAVKREVLVTICLHLWNSDISSCLFAGPNSIPLTLLAKFSEQRVSFKSFSLGLICTNMSVFESPPNNRNSILSAKLHTNT